MTKKLASLDTVACDTLNLAQMATILGGASRRECICATDASHRHPCGDEERNTLTDDVKDTWVMVSREIASKICMC